MAWMVLKEGATNSPVGPFDDGQFEGFIRSGKVKPKSLVGHPVHTDRQWMEAKTVPWISAIYAGIENEQLEKKRAAERELAKRKQAELVAQAERQRAVQSERLRKEALAQAPKPPKPPRMPWTWRTWTIGSVSLSAAILLIAIGAWAYIRYSNPKVNLHSADEFKESVQRIKWQLGPKKADRLVFLIEKRSKGFLNMIVDYRTIGLSGEFHGMTAHEFLGKLEADREEFRAEHLRDYKDEQIQKLKHESESRKLKLEIELIYVKDDAEKKQIEEKLRRLPDELRKAILEEQERHKNLIYAPNFAPGPPK